MKKVTFSMEKALYSTTSPCTTAAATTAAFWDAVLALLVYFMKRALYPTTIKRAPFLWKESYFLWTESYIQRTRRALQPLPTQLLLAMPSSAPLVYLIEKALYPIKRALYPFDRVIFSMKSTLYLRTSPRTTAAAAAVALGWKELLYFIWQISYILGPRRAPPLLPTATVAFGDAIVSTCVSPLNEKSSIFYVKRDLHPVKRDLYYMKRAYIVWKEPYRKEAYALCKKAFVP